MKLQLNNTELEQLLLNIFCNGLSELSASGLDYVYNKENYQKYRVEGACYEDNLMNLLRGGGRLKFVDVEGGDGEHWFLTLESAKEKIESIDNTDFIKKVSMILDEENVEWDAWTAYDVLQYLLFGELVYG